MQTQLRRGVRFPTSIEDFEATFRQEFNREMTPDERTYFHVTGKDDWEEPNDSGGASGS